MPHSSQSATIYDLFREQAARTPDATALVDDRRSITYRDLDRLTDTIAANLQAQGVQTETIVGGLLHDSYTVAIAILAILKAGGTYVLIDRKLPPNRARYILADAQPLLVLTNILSPVSVLKDQRVLQIDILSAATDHVYVPPVVTSENLAHVAYTSGSTGEPKGVMITHGATVNHALAYKDILKLHTNDRAPLMAPAAFDMATEEIIPPLLAGCTLVAAPAMQPSMAKFTQSIIDNAYTFLNLPTALWHEWTTYLRTSGSAIPPKLRLVIVGGDKIYTSRYRQWQALPGADTVQWIAAYGVTEATITSTLYLTAAKDSQDSLDPSEEPYMPIGTPIHGVTAYVVSDDGTEVAPGETGELYIGGAGLARGYLHLPTETADQFISDHFSNQPNARMYKTGDIARRLPNGVLAWIGRKDNQIKINELLIESAEIESALESYSKIDDAVVVFAPSQNPNEASTLVGFIKPSSGIHLNLPYIRTLLRGHLPPTIAPIKLIPITTLPLTASGKLDRKALQIKAASL